jgi:long-chain fatty acid transport protein
LKRAQWILAAGAIFALARVAAANPLDTFGFGSRGTAMGGAAVADCADPSANYYNPAALSAVDRLQVSVGYFRADHHLFINDKDTHVDPVKGLNVALAVPGKVLSVPVAFGLALHLPDDRVSRVRALRQEQPRWELYDNRNQRLYLAANLAIRPVGWLEIGGGLSFMSSTRGRLDITGQANIFSPLNSTLRHEVDADLTSIRYPQFGVRAHLTKRARVGVTYRGEFQLGLDLKARLNGDISSLTTALYDLSTSSVNAFLPRQVVLGGSWDVTERFRANFDVTWFNWAAYIPPVAKLDVVLDIPPPSGGWPAGITPPAQPASTVIVPLNMRDRLVPHLGMEWHAVAEHRVDLFVRGGYEFAKSPIPPQTRTTNYVDLDRHTASLGLGVAWRPRSSFYRGELKLDTHLQWSELVARTTEKEDPADFIGDFRAYGRMINFGTTLTVGF